MPTGKRREAPLGGGKRKGGSGVWKRKSVADAGVVTVVVVDGKAMVAM